MNDPDPESRLGRAREWLVKADDDLLNIDNNLMAARVPWDTLCFHAQQAAEKTLKAILVHDGINPPRTHDLIALLADCVLVRPELQSLQQDCSLLNVYSVASRYPGTGIRADEAIARRVITAAIRVRNSTVIQIASQHPSPSDEDPS